MVKKLALITVVLSIYGCGGGEEKLEDPPPIVSEKLYINGFEVPPEPDPQLNGSTLLGVDSNGNKVRDDIERVIAKDAQSKSVYEAEMYVASIMSGIMDEGRNGAEVYDEINCSSYKYPNVDHMKMFELLINNDERSIRNADWILGSDKVEIVTDDQPNWRGGYLCN